MAAATAREVSRAASGGGVADRGRACGGGVGELGVRGGGGCGRKLDGGSGAVGHAGDVGGLTPRRRRLALNAASLNGAKLRLVCASMLIICWAVHRITNPSIQLVSSSPATPGNSSAPRARLAASASAPTRRRLAAVPSRARGGGGRLGPFPRDAARKLNLNSSSKGNNGA
uniref:Uncharacterized protein n=1 Tax=Oryza meridionalis TaxID=40149 RepID=A0A0E0CSP9_9ORYZ